MFKKKIGALVIGQSPRPDLVAPLRQALPPACTITERGALDELSSGVPNPSSNDYPLTTVLRDGSQIVVAESFLLPRLQRALTRLEEEGAVATVLLCAGTFSGVTGQRPFLKPFDLGRQLLAALGLIAVGFIAPIAEQEAPIRARWLGAGLTPTVWTADVRQLDSRFRRRLLSAVGDNGLEAIVLDYVGHPPAALDELQAISPVPVFDLGRITIAALASIL